MKLWKLDDSCCFFLSNTLRSLAFEPDSNAQAGIVFTAAADDDRGDGKEENCDFLKKRGVALGILPA